MKKDAVAANSGKSLRILADNVLIGECADSMSIFYANDVFTDRSDPSFGEVVDLDQKATPAIRTKIYQVLEPKKLSEMFGFSLDDENINDEIDKLCHTQSQIVRFCKEQSRYMRGHKAFQFLFKAPDGRYVVASAYYHLGPCIYRYDLDLQKPFSDQDDILVVPFHPKNNPS